LRARLRPPLKLPILASVRNYTGHRMASKQVASMLNPPEQRAAQHTQRKYPPEETAPPSVSPGVSPLVGVAVQGMDRMDIGML